jgi:ribosomal protein S18 acetylase RimI-like enzyme
MRLALGERAAPPEPPARRVERSDAAALADLMLGAYRGTVDDEGETLEDAVGEVQGVLDGSYGPFAFDASFVVEDDDGLVGASLVAMWDWESRPLLLYLVVRPEAKRRGMGTALLLQSGEALAAAGHPELDLFVTEANEPAVNLYRKLGFEVVERVDHPRDQA